MGLRDRLIDPRSPERRPRRVAYALPTLFTAGNIFLGYLSILRSFNGAMLAGSGAAGASEHFTIAAEAIGAAVFLDGLDGRIARMTNTTSDFGREMDSLADVVSFGIAPAVLAFTWGVQFVDTSIAEGVRNALYFHIGYCGPHPDRDAGAHLIARLERFRVQTMKTPGLLKVYLEPCALVGVIVLRMTECDHAVQHVFSFRRAALTPAFTGMVHEKEGPSRAAMRKRPVLHGLPALRLVLFPGPT